MTEPYYQKKEREAAERLDAILALPNPKDDHDIGCEEYFNPWSIFPSLYGSYCGDFDRCAIQVLEEVHGGEKVRYDLGAEMFREMLCVAGLCDYGTSPRVCFPATRFREMLPTLIKKWRDYSLLHWGTDVCADG